MPEGPLPRDRIGHQDFARRRRWRLPLMLGGVLAVAAACLGLWLQGGRWVGTDNAYVQADKLLLSTDVSGIVEAILVREGQAVRAGEVLFRLDPARFRIALQGAVAQREQAAMAIEALKAEYRRIQRDIAAQEAAVRLAQAQFERQSALVATQSASRANYDAARFGLQQAEHALGSLRVQLSVALARLGGDPEVTPERHAQWLQAQAAVAEAERQLERSVVRAPYDGVVTQVAQLQPGQYLEAATAAFGLVSATRLWVDAQPKETDLTHVRPGNPARLTVDAYPGRVWIGRVDSVGPASSAQFSVLPPQNTSGNWVKVVQRVPVRIAIAAAPDDPPLRAGMSVEVAIDTGHRRRLADLWPW